MPYLYSDALAGVHACGRRHGDHVPTNDEVETRLHRVLKDRAILSAARVLRRRGWLDETNLRDELDHAGLPPTTVAYLRGVPWNELRAAVEQLLDQAV